MALRGDRSPKSTIQREKLQAGNAFMNECVVDEIGWFDNISRTERDLKSFYDQTGVQPYIILREYDSSLTSDSQKDQWALDYYDQNFTGRENIFLYVYFAERDTDNDVGYMAYALGYEAGSVMDAEAVDIFWSYIDRYWYGDYSTDEVFVQAFTKTGSVIMKVSKTGFDVLFVAMIALIALIVVIGIVKIIKTKRKAEAERAAETERILNAGTGSTLHDQEINDLADRYNR